MKRTWIALAAVVCVSSFGYAVVSAVRAEAINDKCPLAGKAVNAEKTSDVKIGVCCEKCKEKVDKEPARYLKTLDKSPNEKCPITGKAVGDVSSTATVAFCCGNCKGKFDKEPGKYLNKIEAKEKK